MGAHHQLVLPEQATHYITNAVVRKVYDLPV
jgi:hypothetical protein